MNKRGQFFLLAAVILASVIITLSATMNSVRTSREPTKFYDLGQQIKQEGAQVINYGIITNNLSNVVQDYSGKVGDYLADTDPATEIFIIYGNGSQVTVENYAKDDAHIGGSEIKGCQGVLNGTVDISIGGQSFNSPTATTKRSYYGKCSQTIPLSAGNALSINISNKVYNFTLDKEQKFIIVTRKKAGNDTYLDIK